VSKGGQRGGGDLECGRCWGDIGVESAKASWSDDSTGIPDPSPEGVRFNRTDPRRTDLHKHQCLLTDVVPKALPEEPGLQPSLGPSPGGTVKFVFCIIIKGRGFQNLSFLKLSLRHSAVRQFCRSTYTITYFSYPTSTRRHGNFAGVHTLLRIILSSNSAVLINIITGVSPPHFDFFVFYVLCQC
jgi:hypothetical protein